MEARHGLVSSMASIFAIPAASRAINGSSNGAERAFRHSSYRNIQAERELLMHIFYPEPADMTRLMGRIDRVIGQVERAGFLRPIKHEDEDVYEVKRIIKAKISADKLVEIRDQLRQYADARRAV